MVWFAGATPDSSSASDSVKLQISQKRKSSPKRKFWAGYPSGHPAKNFGLALQILEKHQRTKNHAFGKPCLCLRDTHHFRHLCRFTGFEQQSPCFCWLERRFRQKPPLFGGTKARFTKSTVSWTPKTSILAGTSRHLRGRHLSVLIVFSTRCSGVNCFWDAFIQERKISPKRKFWGRTSRGHPGVIRAVIPVQNLGQGKQACRCGHP